MEAIRNAIFGLYEARRRSAPARNYLGASSLGNPCERALWYDFRHASTPDFPARVLRLFETGNREEERVISELRAAGYTVHERNPLTRKQWEVSEFGGHFLGHLDGILLVDGAWHVLELKTSNTRAFKATQKNGVAQEKPVHFAQMQVYLGFARQRWAEWKLGGEAPEAAVYIMVCKETDELHVERVPFDEAEFERLMWTARRTIDAIEPPDRLHDDPSHRDCTWCSHKALCHENGAPRVDCRTCLHSTPAMDGTWRCELACDPIPTDVLPVGCPLHLFIPPLLVRLCGGVRDFEGQTEMPPRPPGWVKYEDGTVNGAGGKSSQELSAMPF